jgi:hypothetical protein
MAKAKVTLNDQGPLTYAGNGYNLARGQSFVTVKDEDILFFYNRTGFTVDLLDGSVLPGSASADVEDEAPAPKKSKTAKPKKAAAAPVEEETEEDDEEEDDEEEVEEEASDELTEDELAKQTKASLAQLAEEKGLKVEANATKSQLIALILSAK